MQSPSFMQSRQFVLQVLRLQRDVQLDSKLHRSDAA